MYKNKSKINSYSTSLDLQPNIIDNITVNFLWCYCVGIFTQMILAK